MYIWQVEEEIGINLNANEMIDLTQLLDPSTGCRTFPSPVCLYQLLLDYLFLPSFGQMISVFKDTLH